MQRLALAAGTLFTGAEGAKVFHRLGDGITKETHNDTATIGGSFNLHVKVHLVGDLFEGAVV